jgi:hypothetical protein
MIGKETQIGKIWKDRIDKINRKNWIGYIGYIDMQIDSYPEVYTA